MDAIFMFFAFALGVFMGLTGFDREIPAALIHQATVSCAANQGISLIKVGIGDGTEVTCRNGAVFTLSEVL